MHRRERFIPVALFAALIGAASTAAIGEEPGTKPDLIAKNVQEFAAAGGTLYWVSGATHSCPQSASRAAASSASASDAKAAAQGDEPRPGYDIFRVATIGGESRLVYRDFECKHDVRTMPHVDSDYLYWGAAPDQIVRVSRNSNPGDPVEVVATGTGVAAGNAQNLVGASTEPLISKGYQANTFDPRPRDIYFSRTTLDKEGRVWYIEDNTAGDDILWRTVPPNSSGGGGPPQIRFPVARDPYLTSYYVDGKRKTCNTGNVCTEGDYVYYAIGPNLIRYNAADNSRVTIYTSPFAGTASIKGIAADDNEKNHNVFFFEVRKKVEGPCPHNNPFCDLGTQQLLIRAPAMATGPQPGDLLHIGDNNAFTFQLPQVAAADGFVFFKDVLDLMRLPENAKAIPRAEIAVTGMEFTQGIQNPDNFVPLYEKRRTFVRVYVKRTDSLIPAFNVTARLYGVNKGNQALLPANGMLGNSPKTSIMVSAKPSREVLDDSFLFELPWEWTKGELTLKAEVNPNKLPIEENYSDNVLTKKITFQPANGLLLHVAPFSYELAGTLFDLGPSDRDDIIAYLRATYPLQSNWQPVWITTQFDAGLGSRVDQSHDDCQDLPEDDRFTCPFDYVNAKLANYQSNWGNPLYLYYYGPVAHHAMIDEAGMAWSSGEQVASGDARTPSTAAHEVGHLFGRNHPFKGSKSDTGVCDQDDYLDAEYPYDDGLIGPIGGGVMGFDPASGLVSSWGTYDFMSYCNPVWISDFTYGRLHIRLPGGTPPPPYPDDPPGPPFDKPTPGDFLSVHGTIVAGRNAAILHLTQRLPAARKISAPIASAYRLQQLDAQGKVLAEHPFEPKAASESRSILSFGETIPFRVGTKEIRIVKQAGDKAAAAQTLASKALSASAPRLTKVVLQNPPQPLAGTVTLAWEASDADGDALTFDVLISRNRGGSFEPLHLGLPTKEVAINSDVLGGTVLFRIVASDGVQTAQMDSPVYTVARKPPTARIIAPVEKPRLLYGQLLNLSGEATDAQDDMIREDKLIWTNQKGQVLGTGALLSLPQLPAGTSVITLTATNRLGLSGSASLSVFVDDYLGPPPPTLAAAPQSLNWKVKRGAGKQQATLAISNTGAGAFEWSSTEDADWLSVSAAAGGAPASITVTADPSGFAPGASVKTTLKLRTTNLPQQQSVDIPVTLSIQDENATVVGNGTPASCTAEALNKALAAAQSAGGGVIRFECGKAPHTIVLPSTLSIQVPVVIDGAGSITLSGDHKVRIFEVCSPSSNGADNIELRLVGLTLTHGKSNPNRAGGAITNYGCRVSVSRSHFVANEAVFEAGAINSLFDGAVTIEDSRFIGNSATSIGGAIAVQGGQLTVRGSTFRDNKAKGGNGGAIYSHEPVVVDVRQSSFIGNHSTSRGGALSIGGKGTVTNSTFWQNSAALGGAAIRHHANGGTLELTNVTVAGNEGKALSGGMALANSLISNAANSENCEGELVAQGPNLEFPGTSCKASLHDVNPQLGELSQSEALPPTVALEPASPARNAASDTICAAAPVNSVDQRGVPRPDAAGKHCDLGAYEFDPSRVPPVLAGAATRRGTAVNSAPVVKRAAGTKP